MTATLALHYTKAGIFFGLLFLSDSPKRAEELAKMVTVEYGEPTGPPVLTTKDAVSKEAFFDEPQFNMTSGDARSELMTDMYKPITAFLFCCF